MTAGDIFFFKTHVTHQMYNHSDEAFYFFALSNRDPEDICEYPDSNKKMERKTRTITQHGVLVSDYMKDEENPKKFWPKQMMDSKK